jgi:hypothetical protein
VNVIVAAVKDTIMNIMQYIASSVIDPEHAFFTTTAVRT